MAPPRRRFAKPLTSRRYLALRHGRNKTRMLDTPELPPGYKQLSSYERPGLVAGAYKIHVKQSISTTARTKGEAPDLQPASVQEVEVLAPRFELPADAVYSVYPEQGHEATHDTLPHVVFNDHMLPWERIGSDDAEEHHPDDYDYNRVPWLAALVFTPDELRLAPSEVAGIFGPTSIKDTATHTESLAVRVPIDDLIKLNNGTAKTPFRDTAQATKPDTTVIFPSATLFNGMFAAYDDDGKPHASPRGGPDISRHRFLAHMMRMNTTGMANADRDEEQTTREFSVVVANRVGPLVADQATQMIVHVVSLGGLESLKPFPLPTSTTADPPQPVRVGLVSLYSWSYTCLPPSSLNVKATFEQLAATSQMLRPVLPELKEDASAVEKHMLARLEDGYTMIRSRTATGEETAALLRGPLTPNIVPNLGWSLLSNSGTNLQILDEGLGMMDLTFSAAWSLGRTLALADRAFTISLTRVRHQILKPATDEARSQMAQATSRSHFTKMGLVRALDGLVNNTVAVSRAADEPQWTAKPTDMDHHQGPDLSYPAISSFLDSAMGKAAYEVAGSLEPKPEDWTLSYSPPYDEFNEPASPDWMVVFRFVLDLYYLVNVPSHYLLTDRSQLPRESLRFFFIDHNWIDALVDGALSLGNHGGTTPDDDVDDPVRRSMKKAINRFFDEPLCLARRPPVPRFGFYLRSAVVAQFPDLRVSVDPTTAKDSGGPMLLRHEVVDKETMLGFFSDKPLRDGLQGLRFELPAHQQYFSAGDVSAASLEQVYRRQYTVQDPKDDARNHPIAKVRWARNARGRRADRNDGKPPRSPVFVWGSTPDANDLRLLLVEKLAVDVHATLGEEMERLHPGWFTEKVPTSAMAAFQLTCPSWQLQIGNMVALADAEAVGRISARLSFREAVVPAQSSDVLAAARTAPAKMQTKLPTHQPKLVPCAIPPHVNWRVHRKHEPPHEASPAAAAANTTTTTAPSSWELVPTSPRSPDSPDPDLDPLSLPPPTRPLPARTAGLPVFTYRITSTLSPSTPSVPMLPTRQDLIFSIVYTSGGALFALTSLVISIPVQSRERPNLLDPSVATTGSGGASAAKMVSNLRFNVRASYSDRDKALELTVVPRSRAGRKNGVGMGGWVGQWRDERDKKGKGETGMGERTELSVVLYGVRVRQYGRDQDCPVWVTPRYKNNIPSREVVYAALRVVKGKGCADEGLNVE